MSRVVVIGGGVAGLAAAHALRGFDVTVIDGADCVGGKLRTSQIAGVDVDEGAESFLVRVPEAAGLARAVGLGDDLVHPLTTSAGVWARGDVRPLPPRTLFGVPSTLGSLRGVLNAAEIMRASLDLALPAGHDETDTSVGALVGRRLGHAVVERLVDPLLGGVYAGRADSLSVLATVPQLGHHDGSLMRTVARTLPTPSTPPAPVFATIRGGLGRLPDAVARASGATVITGRPVRRLERTPTGFRVVHGPTIDERAIESDAVIVAVPAAPSVRLLTDVAPAAATELAGVETASMAIVTTAWRGQDVRTFGSGYLVPAAARRPVKAVTFASAKWAHLADTGVALVRSSIGRVGETADLQRDDADLVSMAVAELRLTGRVADAAMPIETRISRWGGALPQYAVGHLDRVRRIRAAVADVPGLAVCGATYDGVGVPACIRSGQLAADRIKAALTG